MPEIIPSVKLPNSPSGFVLLIHTGLLFFWLYNRSDSSLSYLKPLSISGIVVGLIMYYFVGSYLDNEFEKRGNYSEIFGSAIIFWIITIFAYIILYFILNWFMQPPSLPLTNGWYSVGR